MYTVPLRVKWSISFEIVLQLKVNGHFPNDDRVFYSLKSESINEYSFFRKLETGILLCKHANTVTLHAEEFIITNPNHPVLNRLKVPQKQVRFNEVSWYYI